MTQVYAGASAGFIPNLQASGNLIVEFSRNPSKYALNQYAKIVPTSKNVGYFLRIDTADAIAAANENEHLWPDGNERPVGRTSPFEFVPFATVRRDYGFQIGNLAADQADFPILMAHARIKAQKAMNIRTKLAVDVLRTSGNYLSGNFDTAANIGGGLWAGSTAANAYIRKTFEEARLQIIQSSGGAVGGNDELACVVDPNGAKIITQSPEYQQYLLNHPQAIDAARGSSVFRNFGLLDSLFGFKMIVEHTVVRTSNEGASSEVRGHLLSGGTTTKAHAIFLARPGDLEGVEGAQDMSALTVFVKEDMTVETLTDMRNRRIEGHVVDDQVAAMTAPIAAVGVTNIDAAAD
jgi:hypothetical protein